MQEDNGLETSYGRRWRRRRERGWRRKVAPRGYPREGAGKFFPLGCKQKGNYFNCGQPRSTKLHPMFLLPLSTSLCLCPSLALFPCPRVRLLTLILSLSYAMSRVLSFPSPLSRLFSLLRFVGEHIPSLAAATAEVSRLTRVCLPSWKHTSPSGSRSSCFAFVSRDTSCIRSVEIIDIFKYISHLLWWLLNMILIIVITERKWWTNINFNNLFFFLHNYFSYVRVWIFIFKLLKM